MMLIKRGFDFLISKEATNSQTSPKISASKALALVKDAANDVGIQWPGSAPSSAKRLKTEDEPDEEKSFNNASDLWGTASKHVEGNMTIQDHVRFDDGRA